jgi:arylsulfatase A-like enzyme
MIPTVLECLGIEPPKIIKGVSQSPIEGVSFAHTFDDASTPTRHHTQYFEMMGHRSLCIMMVGVPYVHGLVLLSLKQENLLENQFLQIH